jgi:tRNA (guanine10-N2)-dimethyltransferase
LTPRSLSPPISRRSASRLLFFLSGEETGIPGAEARALVKAQDPTARFEIPHSRVLIATTTADPAKIETRIAYSRRVGGMVSGSGLDAEQLKTLRRGTYAISVFDLREKGDSKRLVSRVADEIGGRVSLDYPDVELTVVRTKEDFFAVTRPSSMKQDWVTRKPRARAFFHPSAIFPKFSRVLVNFSRVDVGEIFLDPFCGTGSLLLEAAEVGALPVGIDLQSKMAAGSSRNMKKFAQDWLGVVRADSKHMPVARVDAIATDIPYGRVSSTAGSSTGKIFQNLIKESSSILAIGRRLVVMHPKSLDVPKDDDFVVEEQHHLPVHKKLVRTITVLRRA